MWMREFESIAIRTVAMTQFCRKQALNSTCFVSRTRDEFGPYNCDNTKDHCTTSPLCYPCFSFNTLELVAFAQGRNLSRQVGMELELLVRNVSPRFGWWEVAPRYLALLLETLARSRESRPLFPLVLFCLVVMALLGNLRSLAAFRVLQRAKKPVYLHQIAIVVSDSGSLLAALLFLFATYALGNDPRLDTGIWRETATILAMATLFTSRWVFLGSLFDRRQAMLDPIGYRAVEQGSRVRRLLAASALGALILSFATFRDPTTRWLQYPPSRRQVAARVCAGGTNQHKIYKRGWLFLPFQSSGWVLAFQAPLNVDNQFYGVTSWVFVAVLVLIITDCSIGVLCVRLLRIRSRQRAKAATLQRQGRTEARARREDALTRVILSLVGLIAVQLLSLAATLVCWEGPWPWTSRAALRRVCWKFDVVMELIFAVQMGGNFVVFLLLNPDFSLAFFGRLKPDAMLATRWAS